MEKDPDRRYPNANELADDLRRYVNRFAILAKRTGPLGRAKKWITRNPVLTAAILAVLLAITTAGAFAWRAHDIDQRRLAEERRREAEAAEEKRRAAIERGMVAALAADLPGAEKAVAEAELLGASPGETRMLQGFIAFHNGQPAEAIGHLELAVRLVPDRVAPRGLLVVAYYFDGNGAAVQTITEVEGMSPETSLDKLFKGVAIAIPRPAEGLRLINEALAAHPSTLGHLLLADARLHLAKSSGNVPDAERAVAASEFAKQLLPDNPERLGTSCSALLTAMSAHERSGNLGKAAEYLDAARREAANLARFKRNPTAIVSRFDVASAVDGLKGKTDLTAELRAARAGRREQGLMYYEAENWFCLGNDREVDAVVSETPFSGGQYLRALAALSRSNGSTAALAAMNQYAGANSSSRNRFRSLPVLYALDRSKFAAVLSQLRRERDPLGNWGSAEQRRRSLAMLDGTCSERDYLTAPAHDQFDLCTRYYFVAYKRLGDDDREGARQAFEEAYRFKLFDDFIWNTCRAMLIRMKDPNWPQAILGKK